MINKVHKPYFFFFLCFKISIVLLSIIDDRLNEMFLLKIGKYLENQNFLLDIETSIIFTEAFYDFGARFVLAYYRKNLLNGLQATFILIGIPLGMVSRLFWGSAFFCNHFILDALGAFLINNSILLILYALKRSFFGSHKIFGFIATLINFTLVLHILNPNRFILPWSTSIFITIFLFVFASLSWPNKPLGFKNIFNELSGDNALKRLLSQKSKASTQCKG